MISVLSVPRPVGTAVPAALDDANGKAKLQSFVSKLLINKLADRYSRTAAKGKKELKCLFLILFVYAAARGGTCAFTLNIVNTLIKNSSRENRPSIST